MWLSGFFSHFVPLNQAQRLLKLRPFRRVLSTAKHETHFLKRLVRLVRMLINPFWQLHFYQERKCNRIIMIKKNKETGDFISLQIELYRCSIYFHKTSTETPLSKRSRNVDRAVYESKACPYYELPNICNIYWKSLGNPAIIQCAQCFGCFSYRCKGYVHFNKLLWGCLGLTIST